MKMLQIMLLFITLYTSTVMGFDTKLKLSVDGEYDSNIPQNITEYGMFYSTPSLFVSLKRDDVNFKLSSVISYENYIVERSAYLNRPFWKSTFSYGFSGESYSITPYYALAFYLYKSFDIAKVSNIFGSDANYEFSKYNGIDGGVKFYLNDYGDNSYDANRCNGDIAYTHKFRVTKNSVLAIRDVGVGYGIEINMADTLSSDYTYHEVLLFSEFKIATFALKLKTSYAMKFFDELEEINYAKTKSKRVNNYMNFYYSVESPKYFSNRVKFQVGGSVKDKDSTNPIYRYSRYTFGFGVDYYILGY